MPPNVTDPSPVEALPDFPALEKKLLKFWYESGIVASYLQRNDKAKGRYSFIDGPITANNPMGIHHGWGRTYKDLFQRFHNMQGDKQRFQNGFDCQGLWVEVEVEKELGLKRKQDIENLVPGDTKASIAKFVDLCKQRVFRFAKIQTKQSKRLGYFMDWDHSYFTLSDDNNYMIWHFLKECAQKGLIYKGRDSVPWCPRCGTAISQHEMLTEDYQEARHDSIYIEYPLLGKKNIFLLAWTTTPWTLPGNVAVAVDKEKEYALTSGSVAGNKYYILKSLADGLGLKVVRTVTGEKLVGLKYESPFDHLPRVQKSMGDFPHTVIAADTQILPISDVEGTGLVHIAPGAGAEDYKLGKKLGLPTIELINEEATYIDGLGEFSDKNAKNHPEIILEYVRKKAGGKYLFDIVPYTHRYPACWRCKTELVWRVVSEWYIAMDRPCQIQNSKLPPSPSLTRLRRTGKTQNLKQQTLREMMMEVAKRIKWIPEFGLERELDWLKNMQDWLISKKRYWGLALPIWECSACGSFEVIGGHQELREKAKEGWEKFEGHSPHRPWIDEVKTGCKQCGKLMARIPDVGNPWLDAGIVPFSTISEDNQSTPLYWSDNQEWRQWVPAHFITESFPGQFKNWFYSLIAMATVLENEKPVETVLGFATLLGEDGRPMHKSWGNAIDFNEGANKIGVDVMRWMYLRQDPKLNLLFGYHAADRVRRQFHLLLWNSYRFVVNNLIVDQPNLKQRPRKLGVLDHWIRSRLYSTVDKVNQALEAYDAYQASQAFEMFVDDFSTWYIRRSRERVGRASNDKEDKRTFYWTAKATLITLAKLLAPFIPFLSDAMYTNLTGEVSVHLADWPQVEETAIDSALEKKMVYLRQIAELGHRERKAAHIKVRQPLAMAKISGCQEDFDKSLITVLSSELNVKTIECQKQGKSLAVHLDTRLTKELVEEGEIRELTRRIQEERKRLQTKIDEPVIVTVPCLIPKRYEKEIQLKTQALKIKRGNEFKVKKLGRN